MSATRSVSSTSLMPKFQVYIRREFDGEIIEKFRENLTHREVQAMRFEEQLLPGKLEEFDSIEMPSGLIRRTPLKRSDKPIPKVSEKRKKLNRVRTKVMREVRERDDNTCQLQKVIGTACYYGESGLQGHEVLKRGRGGSIVEAENILLACEGHNGWVEDHPMLAEVYGLSLPSKS